MHETINFFIQKQKIQNGLISTEKANEYLNRYKELNELEQEQLILFHSRMAFKISKQYIAKNRYEDPSEIYETALHGLVKALNTFDPNKGFKFMTYAYRVVENELLMWTRKKSRRTNEISLEAVLTTDKNNNDLTLEEILAFEDENVTEKLYLSQISDELLCCIKQLSQKQQTIIMKSFELDGEEVETQQSLAQQLSISQSYASSLRDQGISRLKELYTSEWKDILVEREFHNQKLKAIYLAHRDKFSLKDQSMLELFYGIHGNNKYSISELEKLFSTIWDKITEYLMNLIIQLKELSYPYLGYQLSTKQNSILRKQMKKLFLEKESEFTEKEKYVLKHGYQIVGYQKLSIQKMMTELRITRKELEKIHASALKKLAPSPSDLFNKIFAVSYQGGGDLETASSIFLAYKKYESYLTNQEKEFFHTMFQGKYSDITIFLKHMAEVWNISKREIDLFYKKSIKKLNRLNRKKEEHIPTEEELQIIELFSRFHTYLKPSYCDLLEHLYGINGVEHMSIKEYAQILNCSEPNVYNKHHKAINILKNCEQGIFPKSHIPKEPKKLKIEKFQKKKKEIERLYESFKVYLKPDYQELLEAIYGFDGKEPVTVKEFAQKKELVTSNVWTKLKKATEQLKNLEQGVFPKKQIGKVFATQEELISAFQKNSKYLNEKQKLCVLYLYGIMGALKKTKKEISDILKIKESSVFAVNYQALHILENPDIKKQPKKMKNKEIFNDYYLKNAIINDSSNIQIKDIRTLRPSVGNLLKEFSERLSQEQHIILSYFYGFYDLQTHSIDEISSQFGLSHEMVSMYLKQGLSILFQEEKELNKNQLPKSIIKNRPIQ